MGLYLISLITEQLRFYLTVDKLWSTWVSIPYRKNQRTDCYSLGWVSGIAHTTTNIVLCLCLAGLVKQKPLSRHPSHHFFSEISPIFFRIGWVSWSFIWRLRWSRYCNVFVYARITNKKVHKLQARSRSANICHLPTQPESMQLFRGKGHLRSLILEQMISEKSQNVPKANQAQQVYYGQKKGWLLMLSHASTSEPTLLTWTFPLHWDVLQIYPLSFRSLSVCPQYLKSCGLVLKTRQKTFFRIMQWQMQHKDASYWFTPFPALWGKHPSCACRDSVHLEGPYTQPRLLEIFKSEASFLKPVFCLITHTAQVYACTGIGLSYWHLNRLFFFSHRCCIQ